MAVRDNRIYFVGTRKRFSQVVPQSLAGGEKRFRVPFLLFPPENSPCFRPKTAPVFTRKQGVLYPKTVGSVSRKQPDTVL
jgi:hypothetical protein